MKLPMPDQSFINALANRAEEAIYKSGSRTADVHIIENAIRRALQYVIDGMEIQVDPHSIDLSKR